MGVDVVLYAKGDVPDDRLNAVNEFLMDRGVYGYSPPGENGGEWDDYAPPLVRSSIYDGVDYVTVLKWRTLMRYYGRAYERGHWPTIHNAIACMRAALPGIPIHYGGDVVMDDEIGEVSDSDLAELWEHWLSDRGRAYHDRFAVASR